MLKRHCIFLKFQKLTVACRKFEMTILGAYRLRNTLKSNFYQVLIIKINSICHNLRKILLSKLPKLKIAILTGHYEVNADKNHKNISNS